MLGERVKGAVALLGSIPVLAGIYGWFLLNPQKKTPTKYVVGFLFSRNYEKVVLIRKKRPEWQKGFLNGPGGKIEANETPLDAMRREFWEETGFRQEWWSEFVVMSSVNGNDIVHFFTGVADLEGLTSTTDEEIEICKVSALAERKTLANLMWLIPLAEQHTSYKCPIYVKFH